MTDDPLPLPADRSFELDPGHLLPPAPDDRDPLVLDPAAPQAIEWTVERLVGGGVVAFPTDTVYAVAASLAHPAALDRIFAAKRRPPDKPLPVLLASADDLARLALDLDPRVVTLAARYWPGPLTIVVPARDGVPPQARGPGGTVGARVPNHPLALEVIERAGGAVAATSANASGRPPAGSGAEVAAALGAGVDIVLDGGGTPGGTPSTLVGFAGDQLLVLREGAVPRDELDAAWREIVTGDRDAAGSAEER